MKRLLLALLGLWALVITPAWAQDTSATPKTGEEEEKKKEVTRAETVVVTASPVETTVINSPATVSVVTPETIATSSAQNYGDLLRSVPGLNVIQTSARDINLTSRQATSTLTNSQLVLLDGRSIYLDFFGLVLWDFVPQSPGEIKQIEVVRGPASAVWGANALTGVVNIITKPPRDAEGFNLSLQGGLLNRSEGSRADEGTGNAYGANFSYAKAPSEKFAWRLSAGYFNSDPYSRPVGIVPVGTHPLDPTVATGGATYPADKQGQGSFENSGTSQPKVDLRLDQELGEGGSGGRIVYQGGYAGTRGIIHTGIGPFDIQKGSYLAYGKILYTRGALKIGSFGNFVDTEAPNLLLTDPDTGQPVQLNFKTQTYDFELGHSKLLGTKNLLSYGGNFRRNNFDITLTPNGKDRNEIGGYVQEEFFTDKFRLAAGVRVDKFGNLDKAVYSPRVSLMFKPSFSHSVRISFNRAFRSPSVVNNYLDQDIFAPTPIDLRPLGFAVPPLRPLIPQEPFFLRVKNVGNPDLKQESLNAYEVAYTGTVKNRTTLGIAFYVNRQNDSINFTQLTPTAQFPRGLPGLTFYSPANPARGVGAVSGQPITLNPIVMGALALVPPQLGGPILLPQTVATYLNLGPIENRGVELTIDHSFNRSVTAFGNYSFQATPEVKDPDPGQLPYPLFEVGVPARSRFNAGVNWNTSRYLGSVSLNYSGRAFWNDVLSAPYWGFTDSYAMLNAAFGLKFDAGKITTTVKGTNLTNETIQQHIFGDILKLSVAFEVRIFVK